jgi:hypothetical protein
MNTGQIERRGRSVRIKGQFALGVMIWVGPQMLHDQMLEGVVCPSPHRLRISYILSCSQDGLEFPLHPMQIVGYSLSRIESFGRTEMYGRFEGCLIGQHG